MTSMTRRSFGLMLAAVAMVLTCVGTASAAEKELEIGKPAPAFELQGTDGKTHKLADYKGKVVVVHWHSVACPWDIAYQPILAKIATKYAKPAEGQKEVVFVGINSNKSESLDKIKEEVAKIKLPYVVLKDPKNKVADLYAAQATPHLFVIDGEGVLRYRGGIEKPVGGAGDAGKSSEQWFEPALAAIVAGKEPAKAITTARGCSIKRE